MFAEDDLFGTIPATFEMPFSGVQSGKYLRQTEMGRSRGSNKGEL